MDDYLPFHSRPEAIDTWDADDAYSSDRFYQSPESTTSFQHTLAPTSLGGPAAPFMRSGMNLDHFVCTSEDNPYLSGYVQDCYSGSIDVSPATAYATDKDGLVSPDDETVFSTPSESGVNMCRQFSNDPLTPPSGDIMAWSLSPSQARFEEALWNQVFNTTHQNAWNSATHAGNYSHAVFACQRRQSQDEPSQTTRSDQRSSQFTSMAARATDLTPTTRNVVMRMSARSVDDEEEPVQGDKHDTDYSPTRSGTAQRPRQARRLSNKHHHARTCCSPYTKISPGQPEPTHEKYNVLTSSALSSTPSSDLAHRRPFTCPLRPYSCFSTFKSKNEWKRHMRTKHLCLHRYRCKLCPNVKERPNDFNRKDLFTQHLKRMHPGVTEAQTSGTRAGGAAKRSKTRTARRTKAVRAHTHAGDGMGVMVEEPHQRDDIYVRCWSKVREPPKILSCAFCTEIFEGRGEYCVEVWLEHVGTHLTSFARGIEGAADAEKDEDGRYDACWASDHLLRTWLVEEGFVVPGAACGTWVVVEKEKGRMSDEAERVSGRGMEHSYYDEDAEGEME